ncbi:hypothetical protein PVAP13_9KG215185, partial [Panicum virgatum]
RDGRASRALVGGSGSRSGGGGLEGPRARRGCGQRREDRASRTRGGSSGSGARHARARAQGSGGRGGGVGGPPAAATSVAAAVGGGGGLKLRALRPWSKGVGEAGRPLNRGPCARSSNNGVAHRRQQQQAVQDGLQVGARGDRHGGRSAPDRGAGAGTGEVREGRGWMEEWERRGGVGGRRPTMAAGGGW